MDKPVNYSGLSGRKISIPDGSAVELTHNKDRAHWLLKYKKMDGMAYITTAVSVSENALQATLQLYMEAIKAEEEEEEEGSDNASASSCAINCSTCRHTQGRVPGLCTKPCYQHDKWEARLTW